MEKLTRIVCMIGIFAVTWWFYSWTARSSGKPFAYDKGSGGHYELLTDAFESGRLSLPVEPVPQLLQLDDPYDPDKNAPYRVLHDASLYRTKYYLYFGPTPVISLLLPLRFVTALR